MKKGSEPPLAHLGFLCILQRAPPEAQLERHSFLLALVTPAKATGHSHWLGERNTTWISAQLASFLPRAFVQNINCIIVCRDAGRDDLGDVTHTVDASHPFSTIARAERKIRCVYVCRFVCVCSYVCRAVAAITSHPSSLRRWKTSQRA